MRIMTQDHRSYLAVLVGVGLLLASACAGENDGPPAPSKDGSSGPPDPGAPSSPSTPSTPSTPSPGGVTGAKTCAQIDECMAACNQSDMACLDKCFYEGTAAAQAQMAALEQCDEQAFQTTCKSQCATESQACWDCLDQACAAQIAACFGS